MNAGATWVEWGHADGNGHLLFACDGRVYRLTGWRDLAPERYLREARLLADFNGMRFELAAAPSSAMQW